MLMYFIDDDFHHIYYKHLWLKYHSKHTIYHSNIYLNLLQQYPIKHMSLDLHF